MRRRIAIATFTGTLVPPDSLPGMLPEKPIFRP
jgi:hypothetical protein